MKNIPDGVSVLSIFRFTPSAAVNACKIALLVLLEVKRRFYSNTIYYILRRNLSVRVQVPLPRISLSLRELRADDIPALINIHERILTIPELWERVRILNMINSGIQTPYVAVTVKDEPCHLAWLIDSRSNEKIQSFFKGAVKPLSTHELLFEFVFTLEKYRGLGIQVWRSLKFAEKGAAMGAKWALGYIKKTNETSLKNAQKNEFKPYMIRFDRWRFFCRKTEYRLLKQDQTDPCVKVKVAKKVASAFN